MKIYPRLCPKVYAVYIGAHYRAKIVKIFRTKKEALAARRALKDAGRKHVIVVPYSIRGR